MHVSLPVKFALVSFVVTLFGVVGVSMMAYRESDKLLQQGVVKSFSQQIQQEADVLESQAGLIKEDVAFLAHSDPVKLFAAQFSDGNHRNHQADFDFSAIESLCAGVLMQRDMYYQVRLIGVADGGRELVRVARLRHGIEIVKKDQLMRKAKRGYFKNSIRLKPGEFLFSDITLNKEHGIITQPPQPMLRVSTALYDRHGRVCAILLINVDFNVFTKTLHHRIAGQQFFMTNAHGDYLIHPDGHKAMAFEYQRQATVQQDFQLKKEFLVHQQQDKYGVADYLFDQQSLMLMLKQVHLDHAHPDRFLNLGATFTLHQLRAQSLDLRDRMLWLTFGLALLLGFITYELAKYLTRPIRKLTSAAVKISHGEQGISLPQAGHDEIGRLSTALQQMVEHLRQSRQQTEALNKALEVKVSKRTAELARLAGELEAQNTRLEQALLKAEDAAIAKGQFLATMSHEIRTPLNGILGLTELVLAARMYPEQRNRMEIIQSSGQALLTILNDILDYSKIEAGQMEMKHIAFNPNEVVEHVSNLFARQVNADESRLELIARGIPNLPCLLIGDSDRLHQVLLNLLSNAVKFTEQGDIIIAVDLLSETDTHACIRFELADSGRGISERDQQRLFEEFTQADGTDTRKHGGTGLGLAIVKRLVAMMGGEIAVESEIGKGSRFYFDLCLQKGDVIADGPHQFGDSFAQWRVLAVDDNLSNQAMLHGMLTAWGSACETCSSAQDALKLLHDRAESGQPYDLILIDQQIEGMDGMALARVIKETPELAALKVMMTTTLDMAFDAALRETYGLDGYIRKPVYVYSLFETILDVMGVRQRRVRHVSVVSQQQRNERILLAEDNAVNRQVAMGMLENQGFVHVDAAHDGAQAVGMMMEQQYDLILMDVQMPELDGISATRKIREMETAAGQGKHVPIIALTAHAQAEDMQRSHDAGMDAHLSKPLTGIALREMLQVWLPEVSPADVSDAVEPMSAAKGEDNSLVEECLVDEADAAVNATELRQLRADMGFGIGMIIDTYLTELPGQIDAIKQAIADGDGDTLRRNGHRLKGASRSVAAAPLGEMCFQLEKLGQNGDIEAAKDLFDAFTEAVAAVQQALAADWVNDIR